MPITIDSSSDHTIKTFTCRVALTEKLSHNVMRLCLTLPESEKLSFQPGQHINILLRDGKRRSFSLANAPHDDLIELHIRHFDEGIFSDLAFHELKENSMLYIEGPFGSFSLKKDSKKPAVMVAGGTGFAPVKSIIEYLLTCGLKKSIYIYWGARTRRDLYLHELAQYWSEQHELIHYIPVLSESDSNDQWQGKTGLVHEAVLNDFEDLSLFEVYTYGPLPMVHAVRDSFVNHGIAAEFIYSDVFEYATT